MYDPTVVTTRARQLERRSSTRDSPYKGKVTAYNYAIYIADAALYLMKTKPELGITNPYALDDDPARGRRRPAQGPAEGLIGKYWGTAQEEIDGFANGDMAIGTAWQYQANTINAAKRRRRSRPSSPRKARPGWSDTWMISSKAKHPNCMYKWMDYIISPEANAEVTVYFGEAPVSDAGLRRGREAERRPLRRVPRRRRGLLQGRLVLEHADRRPASTAGRTSMCTDFDAWTKAWTEVTGS